MIVRTTRNTVSTLTICQSTHKQISIPTTTHSSQSDYLTLTFNCFGLVEISYQRFIFGCRIGSDFLFASCNFGQIKIVCVCFFFYHPPPLNIYQITCVCVREILATIGQCGAVAVVYSEIFLTFAMQHYD